MGALPSTPALEPGFPATPARGQVFPAFAIMGWRWISRNPASAIAPVLIPFIFLYFLHIVSPAAYFPLEVVGAMLFTTQNIGNWVMGDSATWRLENGLQDLFVASPLGRFRYLTGIALSNLIPAAPALLVLGVVLALTISVPPLGWACLVACILVLWMLFSSIGITISSRLRTRREIWPVGNLSFTALGMATPLYYPISVLPGVWQKVVWYFPGTYAALLAQGGTGITPADPSVLLRYAALLLGLAVAGIVLSMSLYRWREDD